MSRLAGLALAIIVSSASGAAAETTYRRVCDASAAVALDAGHFIVAEDEQDTLKTYAFGEPQATASLDLADYLGNRDADGKAKDGDIEGAARVGDRIFWITSHGRNTDGERKQQRLRFFATPVVNGAAVLPAAAPYKSLLDDLIAAPQLASLGLKAAADLKPEDPGGFNVEGLAGGPDGKLLIGLRNPRKGDDALVVPLDNPLAVVDGSAKAQFGDPIALPLGKRGIRSIEWIGGRYLIAAGPIGEEAAGFAIFSWSGEPGSAPVQVPAALGDLRPEALFMQPGSGTVHVLSDDGSVQIDGMNCKKQIPDKRQFRALDLGPMLPPSPIPKGPDGALYDDLVARFTTLISGGGRYMERNCQATELAGWEGFVLQRCRYNALGTEATVTMLNPDPDRLARWIITACHEAGAADMAKCTSFMRKRVWLNSNAQFPVEGFVVEPESVLGGDSEAPLCFLFRDGVTVRTASVKTQPPADGACGPDSANAEPLKRAYNYARIASTSREELKLIKGMPEVGLSGSGDVRFADAAHIAWQRAWSSDRNALLSAAALSGKATGAFP